MAEQYCFDGMAPLSLSAATVFFALYPDADGVARASSIADELRRRYRWSGRLRPLHVTLHKLGDRFLLQKSKIEDACRIAETLAYPQFEIIFDRVTSFATKRDEAPIVMFGTVHIPATRYGIPSAANLVNGDARNGFAEEIECMLCVLNLAIRQRRTVLALLARALRSLEW